MLRRTPSKKKNCERAVSAKFPTLLINDLLTMSEIKVNGHQSINKDTRALQSRELFQNAVSKSIKIKVKLD